MLVTLLAVAGGGTVAVGLARAARRADAGRRARFLSDRPRWRLPVRPRAALERALVDAALEIAPEAACELALAAAGGIGMLTLAVAPGVMPIATVGALAAGPVALRVARGRAERHFIAALPAGLEQVAAALRGGATVSEAIDALAATQGPLAADLRRVRARASLGLGLADALAAWPTERALPAVRAVAGSLAVATTIGGRAADALDGLASSLRERLGAVAEARALAAQARLSAIVVGAAPAGYLLFSAAVDPSSVDVLLSTHVGRVCLAVGLACEGLAAVWMRHILGRDVAA